MKIHMVVCTSKPMDEWINTNVVPYLSEIKANNEAERLNKTRTEQEISDYMEYVVETHPIAA